MKKWIIALSVILGVGILVAVVVLIVHFAPAGNEADALENKTITEKNSVYSLDLDVLVGDVELLPSEDGKLHIDYVDGKYYKYDYTYVNGTAKFIQKKQKTINVTGVKSYSDYKAKIYIPDTLNDDLDIDLASGKIVDKVGGLNLNKMEIEVLSGSLKLNKVTVSGTIEADLTSGSINLTECSANKLELEVTSGSIAVGKATAEIAELSVKTGTSNINELNANSVDVEVKTGGVKIGMTGAPEDYRISGRASTGSVAVKKGATVLSSGKNVTCGGGLKPITIAVNTGSVEINFA